MPRATVVLGAVLIVLGLAGWLVSGFASLTALIPAALGLVLGACGLLAYRDAKLGIHLALLVAVLGVAGTSMNVVKIGDLFTGTAERPLAVVVSVITFLLLLGYIVAGIRSFVAARRARADVG